MSIRTNENSKYLLNFLEFLRSFARQLHINNENLQQNSVLLRIPNNELPRQLEVNSQLFIQNQKIRIGNFNQCKQIPKIIQDFPKN